MELIPLHLGFSHFKTPAVATQAMQAALDEGVAYYGPHEGTPTLRNAIARRYFEDEGIPLPAEQVLVTHGTKHALYLYFRSLLKPNDEVIALAPYWFAFPELVQEVGVTLIAVPANPEKNYQLPLENLKKAITPNTRLLILTNPGNPTGKVYSLPELEAVAQLLETHPNLHVLSDEIYDGLVYDKPMHSFLRFEHLRERIAVVNGFSKSFAMAGWRVGYLIAPMPIITKATALQQKLISGVSPLNQAGATAVLQQRHQIWEGFRDELLAKRIKTANVLRQLPNMQFYLPDAGYYFTLDVSGYLKPKQENSPYILVEEWAAALKEQVGLEVLPGTDMGMPTAVRMSFGLPDDLLDSALQHLKAFLS
ncbi:pyridoxal phosphate-dependent aminotransferase [Rufibacter sp. LB8]|uniref:pyridoxal phosphate-dependent aminotransferase n=1 Tax=Rufibacter sp. LB8 TaxID=2777781 RepID=UPI00178C3773|nr:aminotransferase class I/II-fold pyridoxal phosphate-dependent enzyme [Rufibacter sp. LB8]